MDMKNTKMEWVLTIYKCLKCCKIPVIRRKKIRKKEFVKK